MLAIAEIANSAAQTAAKADFVILSMHGKAQLSVQTTNRRFCSGACQIRCINTIIAICFIIKESFEIRLLLQEKFEPIALWEKLFSIA